MWNIPSQSRLDQIPKLYETEDILLKDKLIFLHFFIGASDWYVAEFNGDDTFLVMWFLTAIMSVLNGVTFHLLS